jgi:hypothetical protein
MADDQQEAEGPDLSALYAELEGKTVQEILQEGQKALFIDLVVKCRSGAASHQELAILRNVLKDNGLTLGIPPETVQAAEQRAQREAKAPLDLPSFDVPDYMQ